MGKRGRGEGMTLSTHIVPGTKQTPRVMQTTRKIEEEKKNDMLRPRLHPAVMCAPWGCLFEDTGKRIAAEATTTLKSLMVLFLPARSSLLVDNKFVNRFSICAAPVCSRPKHNLLRRKLGNCSNTTQLLLLHPEEKKIALAKQATAANQFA